MIDEKKLLNDLDGMYQYFDKDGERISADRMILRVSDIKALINKQNVITDPMVPMVVQTKETKVTNWYDIKKMAITGTLKDFLRSGDVLPLTLTNGDEVNLVVGYDGSGRAYFIFDKAMSDRHVMNKEWTNKGGYAGSEMARYADEDVFSMLPAYLQQIIEPTKIVQVWDGESRETEHKLFCLSYTQVFGYDEDLEEQEPQDEQIDIFKNPLARVKMRCGAECASWWWLRSAYHDINFYNVNTDGSGDYAIANYSGAVVLGFCLEPNQ